MSCIIIYLCPVLSYIFVILLYFWTPGHKLAHYEVFSNFHTINSAKDERFSSEYYCLISVTSGLAYLSKLLSLWLFNQKLTLEFLENLSDSYFQKCKIICFLWQCCPHWKFFPLSLLWRALNNTWTRSKPHAAMSISDDFYGKYL